jgi:hypothetical protein
VGRFPDDLSGSSLEHDPQPEPLQIEIDFFLDFQRRQSSKLFDSESTHWSPALKAPLAPSFTTGKIDSEVVASNKKLELLVNDVRATAAARRCRHRTVTSDRRGTLAAAGSRVEPFVGSLFPSESGWRTCHWHGGAWNKTLRLLITHTRVRIE